MGTCRSMVMLLVTCLAVAGEGGEHPLAAADTEAAVLAHLASDVPLDRAWGAYRAGQLAMVATVPRLRELLAEELAVEEPTPTNPLPWVVDALICLDAKGPDATAVTALMARQPYETIILAGREPKDHVDLLRSVATGENRDEVWMAAVNLLVELKDLDIFAVLLDGLPLTLEVDLYDSTEELGALVCLDGHDCGGRGAFGWRPYHDAWPPRVGYRLAGGSFPGSTILADGPTVIHYRRVRHSPISRDNRVNLTRGSYGLAWAAKVLYRLPDKLLVQLACYRRLDIRNEEKAVRSDEDLVAALEAMRQGYAEDYRRLLNELVRTGRLTTERAAPLKPVNTATVSNSCKKWDLPITLPEAWVVVAPPLRIDLPERPDD